jgi:hypothetical protein
LAESNDSFPTQEYKGFWLIGPSPLVTATGSPDMLWLYTTAISKLQVDQINISLLAEESKGSQVLQSLSSYS